MSRIIPDSMSNFRIKMIKNPNSENLSRTMSCPLCHNGGAMFEGSEFHLCDTCRGIYRHQSFLPEMHAEIACYESHNNDVHDHRYQSFVDPIYSSILRDFGPEHKGLDFGAGTGPVISKLLHDKGYNVSQYDPFFHDHPALLQNRYDYIACCEVIEHFFNPDAEFALLKKLLHAKGKLYCMTLLYKPGIDFKNWVYIKDETHAFIYQASTIKWIYENYAFASCSIKGRLITFETA